MNNMNDNNKAIGRFGKQLDRGFFDWIGDKKVC
jgi:hypothetical protein